MENFASYFTKDSKIMLENVSYESVPVLKEQTKGKKLDCKDSIVASVKYPLGVRIVFNRRMTFDPEELFVLSVSFSALLKFDPEKRDLVDWRSVDLVKEFTRAFPTLLATLNARTTLLVAQITSAAGASPLIPIAARPQGTTGSYKNPEQ
ncbi:MAG: hypothetical protein IKR53_03995 [Clostridia bacterium]|nr:hypothetical protein [Clostridia bacterium]